MVKCKYCKNIVEDGSLYCRFCGSQLFRSKKQELSIPKPKQRADGTWAGQLMVNGKRITVRGSTVEEYELNARATKAGLIASRDEPPKFTLGEIIDSYIASNENVLSPSTIRGYATIRKHRFQKYMQKDLQSIAWQKMVNDEALLCSAKTVKNAWGLISASLAAADQRVPNINLPKTQKKDTLFLDYEQIKLFLDEIKGKPGELSALLALHSLRQSEIMALRVNDIHDGYIHVNKAKVPNERNYLVEKKTTKTKLSTRVIPVLIHRLLELMPEPSNKHLCPEDDSTMFKRINRYCEEAGLPKVGCHGLRRSFASLCYHLGISEKTVMQLGGWSNMQTVHQFYIKWSEKDRNVDVDKLKDYFNSTSEDG